MDLQAWCLGSTVTCRNAGDDQAHLKRAVFDPRDAKRPVLADGGYCQRCYYERQRQKRGTRRLSAVRRLYDWVAEELDALRGVQRGRCAICQRRVGVVKNGSIDHDHRLERLGVAKRWQVRGILCSTCNRYLGHIGDDPTVGIRLAMYLIDPPAPKLLRELDKSRQVETD